MNVLVEFLFRITYEMTRNIDNIVQDQTEHEIPKHDIVPARRTLTRRFSKTHDIDCRTY